MLAAMRGRDADGATAARAGPAELISTERIVRVAAFRAGLRYFLRESERAARRCGLTPQRYQLLLAIKGAPDGSERLNFTELADRLQLSRNAVTELVQRAEQAGLVARAPSRDDQRVVFLEVTNNGARRLNAVLHELDANRTELAGAFQHLTATFRPG